MEQRTEEWYSHRAGKVTASRIADIIATTKTGYSTSRENYLSELLIERLTGRPLDRFTSPAMEWGTMHEDDAANAYTERTFNIIEKVSFVDHPTIEHAGASPDGYVDGDGLIEIKCPNTSTHIATLMKKNIPSRYQSQMLWQMECTGRRWCDFVSFDPRLPPNLRLFIQRFEWDDARAFTIRNEVQKFLADLKTKIDNLNNMYPG